MVVEVSKKYLPGLSKGFSSPKHTLIIGDGFPFLKEHPNEFDVIITDSSDPIGSISYYLKLKITLHRIHCLSMHCVTIDTVLQIFRKNCTFPFIVRQIFDETLSNISPNCGDNSLSHYLTRLSTVKKLCPHVFPVLPN